LAWGGEERWARSVAGRVGFGGVFLDPDVGQEWREALAVGALLAGLACLVASNGSLARTLVR